MLDLAWHQPALANGANAVGEFDVDGDAAFIQNIRRQLVGRDSSSRPERARLSVKGWFTSPGPSLHVETVKEAFCLVARSTLGSKKLY